MTANYESEPTVGRKPPPLKKSQPAPFETSKGVSMDSGMIGDFARNRLMGSGVDPDHQVWCIPLRSLNLRTGKVLADGFMSLDPFHRLHVFRYTAKEGFQLTSVAFDAARPSVSTSDGCLVLSATFPDSSPVELCTCVLDDRTLRQCRGTWIDYWRLAISGHLNAEYAKILPGLVDVNESRRNALGAVSVQMLPSALIGVGSLGFRILPSNYSVNYDQVVRWRKIMNSIQCLHLLNGVPHLVRLSGLTSVEEESIATELAVRLPECGAVDYDPYSRFSSSGLFEAADGNTTRLIAIECSNGEAREYLEAPPKSFQQAYTCHGRTVLVDKEGQCLCIRANVDDPNAIDKHVPKVDGLYETPERTLWVPFVMDGPGTIAGRVELHSDHVDINNGHTHFPLEHTTISVTQVSPGELRCAFQNGKAEMAFFGTESLVYAFWGEWDAKKTALGLQTAGIADLYSQYNTAKRHGFLLLLFGDIVMLNRSLDSGISMDELVRRINELGSIQFAENDDLRNATVSKLLTLVSTLPAIKQKFEVLATMGPYQWSHQEIEWVAKAFGVSAAKALGTNERKRIVPIVRRHMRLVQGDLLRSLAQIEAAARPIESILAKDEMDKHWSSKARKLMPLAVQGTLGGIMLLVPGGGTAVGLKLIGGALATNVLGGVLNYFQKDREAAAQVQRAAETVFPWWQVFIKTLVVSIFESAEFVDEESTKAMKRDRTLMDSVPADKQPKLRQSIQNELRKRIVNERRNRYAEVLQGSGIRYQSLLDDLDGAADRGIRESINSFSNGLIHTGGTK